MNSLENRWTNFLYYAPFFRYSDFVPTLSSNFSLLSSARIAILDPEPLDPSLAEDPLNYEIRDLNINMPELDDGRLFIDFIELRGGALRIFTRGMDFQPEEHFEVRLRNLRDLSGNPIAPNPRTVTVVQRLDA